MKTFITFIFGTFFGFCLALFSVGVAHTPCDTYDPPERCGYEYHVDPQTGQLESVYVCH